MDKFRKTFSMRKKKPDLGDSSKPQVWIEDEKKIKEGSCSFHVKYLGCIEVFESRGMQVCEEAIKALRKSKKKSQRAILYVSGDALRVSDEISQHLIVDQTIEKVSFCAPDRGHEKGFAYICRDGATRRWMCHAFLAVKESGERLSHAVGCAFAICLEKKQKREREAVQVTCPTEDATFARMSSFRQATLSERLFDPQSAILVERPPAACERKSPSSGSDATSRALVPYNESTACDSATLRPGAIPRPRASPSLIERQTSLRLFPKLQETSPFKQSLSLRMAEMPSSLQRINRMMNGQTIPEEKTLEFDPHFAPPVSAAAATSTVSNNTTNIAAFLSSPPTAIRPSNSPVTTDNATKDLPVQRAGSSTGSSDLALGGKIFEAGDSNALVGLSDPFSAAPFNPATIQQHYHQQQQQQMELKPPSSEPFAASNCRTEGFVLQGTDWPASAALPPAATPSNATVAATAVPTGVPTLAAPEVTPAARPAPATFGMAFFGNSQSLTNAHSTPGAGPAVNGQWLGPPSSWTPAPQPPPVLLPEPDKITDPFDVRWAERASALATSQLVSACATSAQPSTLRALATDGSGASPSPLSPLPLTDTGFVQTNPFLAEPAPAGPSSLVQIINPGQ